MNIHSLDWNLLRTFLAVYERGSLLAAARALGSHQPTVGRHVTQLEQSLGVTLFVRTGRGLVPTDLAHAVATAARGMAQGADAVTRALQARSTSLVGAVRISASQMVATYALPPLIAELRREEPGLELEIVASNALSNLLRREADIAVRMVRPRQASLVARRIAEVRIGSYASAEYLRRRSAPRVPADLLQHELIGLDADPSMLQAFARMGLPLTRERFGVRTDDHVVGWQAMRAGAGIGFAAHYVARQHPDVQPVLPTFVIPPLPMWLAVHREIRGSARIRRVFDFLAERLPRAVE